MKAETGHKNKDAKYSLDSSVFDELRRLPAVIKLVSTSAKYIRAIKSTPPLLPLTCIKATESKEEYPTKLFDLPVIHSRIVLPISLSAASSATHASLNPALTACQLSALIYR